MLNSILNCTIREKKKKNEVVELNHARVSDIPQPTATQRVYKSSDSPLLDKYRATANESTTLVQCAVIDHFFIALSVQSVNARQLLA